MDPTDDPQPRVPTGSARHPRLTAPRRYQLDKESVRAVERGHPWIYRRRLSTAASVFADGQWLRLVDGANRVVGWGIYEAEGAIGVRVLKRGEGAPDGHWLGARIHQALAWRGELRRRTDGFRLLHGENDGVPAVTLDVYGAVGVLQTYSPGADALGRLAACIAGRGLDLEAVLWKPARRRRAGGPQRVRALSGALPQEPIIIHEGGGPPPSPPPASGDRGNAPELTLWVDPVSGQKSGAFLDLRGLRRWVAGRPLQGKRVLNLFSYTGALGVAAQAAGAAEVWNVDSSAPALAFGERHHGGPGVRWIEADIFDWLPGVDRDERFDLVLVDPPLMTSRRSEVPRALAAYRRLYAQVADRVAAGGRLVACCCTSRIGVDELRGAVEAGLGPGFRFGERLPPEPDHPVRFPESDYLKILVYPAARGKP